MNRICSLVFIRNLSPLLLFLFIVVACKQNSDPASPVNEEPDFAIYFLENSQLTENDIRNTDISSLVLKKEAWLTNNDIKYYDYSTHCIYLKTDKSFFFENYEKEIFRFNPILTSKPFVVTAGNERIYIGAFHSGALSTFPIGPAISELDVSTYPEDVIHISKAWTDSIDVRNNIKIKELLINNHLFRAGIEIELLSFQLIKNSDTSTAKYEIEIRNNDEDDLLVIDPEKMGSELFHYYNNGVDLWDFSIPKHFYSEYKKVKLPEPINSWNIDWYTKIKSNHSLKRTIELKGYPRIPIGEYIGSLIFNTPNNITKENRISPQGRIWLGSINSNRLDIKISIF